MEELKQILNEPKSKRDYKMFQYAINLLERDLSHIKIQSENRFASSERLDDLLFEVRDTLNKFK